MSWWDAGYVLGAVLLFVGLVMLFENTLAHWIDSLWVFPGRVPEDDEVSPVKPEREETE